MRRGNLGFLICLLHFPFSKPLGLRGCTFPWGCRFSQTLAHRFQLSRWLRKIRCTAHLQPQQNMNVSEVQHVYPVYFIVFPSFKTNVCEVIDWPHVRQSGFQNPGNFCFRNLKSWALESGIHPKESEMPVTFEIWDRSSTWGIRNPESTAWNPETRMILGVVETIIGSLLCQGVGIVQCLFNRRLVVAPVRNTKKLNWSLFWITLLGESMNGCAKKIIFWFLTMKYIC